MAIDASDEQMATGQDEPTDKAQEGPAQDRVDSVDRASQAYLRGELPVEQYEELLNRSLPSTDTLLQALQENRGFVTDLAKRLKQTQ